LVRAIRGLKVAAPEIAQLLSEMLTKHAANPNAIRWSSSPPPVDSEQGMSLLQLDALDESTPVPQLPPAILDMVDRFVLERQRSCELIAEGFQPPGTALLTGAPGTGKTMLARHIAKKLSLPMATLDLATSISSFLGKTGFNLKKVLDFARSRPCVLLLDEFDAIAKKRDDSSDLGELKRIVNVLLKELEQWPMNSVLIAATNHPELLDRAILRRFDLVLEVPLPGPNEREEILRLSLGRFHELVATKILGGIAKATDGLSGSDIHQLALKSVRNHLLSKKDLSASLVAEVLAFSKTGSIGDLIRALRSSSKKPLSVRELADIFDKSVSTIQHHLKKDCVNG
jgi:SpoVK/Ycf46/Vps4 family AAA+-type ATPase